MRVFGLMFFLLSLPVLASTDLTTQIYDIDYGSKSGDEVLVLLTSGHVARVRESNDLLANGFMDLKAKGRWYNIRLDKNRFITKIQKTDAPFSMAKFYKPGNEKALMEYVPTTIASMDIAKKYFREARYNPKDSQCFNRAAIWTYEWWKGHSLKSNKILIYFTRTYIRRYNFEWWFHIAPLIHVMENGKVVEKVMDRKYTSGPIDMPKWKNIFLHNDADCPIITKFADYADYPYSGECFLQRTHMYTYQPADLQMYDAWGYNKENFNMTEIRQAYKEAFDENI